jgi:hypothetical protein
LNPSADKSCSWPGTRERVEAGLVSEVIPAVFRSLPVRPSRRRRW